MAKPTRRFVPRLEAFDERCLPSAVTVVYAPSDTSITINGNAKGNDITITDDGTNGDPNVPGEFNVRVIVDGVEWDFNVPVSRIRVIGGGGVEHVTYNLVGDMAVDRTVDASLGGRDDFFSADLHGHNILFGADYVIQAHGDAGNDTLSLNASGSHVEAGATLTVNLQGDKGKDAVTVTPPLVDPSGLYQDFSHD